MSEEKRQTVSSRRCAAGQYATASCETAAIMGLPTINEPSIVCTTPPIFKTKEEQEKNKNKRTVRNGME